MRRNLARLISWLLSELPGEDGRTLPWRLFDRAIRPFSFAVSLATAVLTVGIIEGATIGVNLESGFGGHVILFTSAVTTGLLWWGWWGRSRDAMTNGLLLSAAVWAAAGAAILLEGVSWVSGLVALCWSAAGAGSWLLEVNDPNVKGG